MIGNKKDFFENKEKSDVNASVKDIDIEKLETKDERKARIRSIWVIYIETFIFAISFSIVITGVFPYLKQVSLLN